MSERGESDLVFEGCVPDRVAAFTGRFGRVGGGDWVVDVAALDHEAGDYAVESGVVIGVAGAEGEEVLFFLSPLVRHVPGQPRC